MKIQIVCLSLVCGAFAAGQQPPEKTAFEVASIKPAAPSPMNQIRVGMNTDAGMVRYNNVSLLDCIRTAYRVKDFQVEGPEWLGSTRFDIVAKLPAGASESQIPEMLRTLLAERFQLQAHRETKDHAIYALVAARGGPKLKKAEAPAGETTSGKPGRGGMAMRMDESGMHLQASSTTLANLGEMVSRFSERPVVDMTGIEGQYDFDLAFSPETVRGMGGMGRGGMQPADAPAASSGTLDEALQRYGLKLEPRKAPMETIVVDRMEKTPSEN